MSAVSEVAAQVGTAPTEPLPQVATYHRGRVKWFNDPKGYGFIEGPHGEDVFVHYSAIDLNGYKSLREGQWVNYTLIDTPKGAQAQDVRLIPALKWPSELQPNATTTTSTES